MNVNTTQQRSYVRQRVCSDVMPKLTVGSRREKCDYTNQEKLEYAQRQSREVVRALRSASQSNLIRALADRIELCLSPKNLITGTDLHNSLTGEVFDGKGSLWACNSRLCPNCCGNLSRRNRKKVKAILENEKLLIGENWYFVTLTQPDLSLKGLNLLTVRSVMYMAHRKFYRSEFWKKLSRGSIKGEEFTIGNFDQFHYHIHKLAICRSRIQRNNFIAIRRAWTKALESSFKKHGIKLQINTKDGYANVNVEKVRDKGRAIFEICKYLTKNDSWSKLDRETLVQIAEIERFPRMFEIFGVCKGKEETRQKDDAKSEEAYLDRNNLTVKNDPKEESRRVTWRTACQLLSREKWLEFLNKQFVICCGYRKEQLKLIFPYASFKTLSGVTF